MTDAIRAAFAVQAGFCRETGSAFTAALLEVLSGTLDRDTQTGRAILDWPGDCLADALSLRLTGGLHALARSGAFSPLSELYRSGEGDIAAVLGETLVRFDDRLTPWLDSPPQTNEVGRSGALMAGLMVAAARLAMPVELLELGSSAGLNLNLDRFHYRLGGVEAGPGGSGVRIAPEWRGPPPPEVWPEIVARAGVDRNPLDVSDRAVAERLIAYVWPDQAERLARIEAAIALAQRHRPPVEQSDAAEWIEGRLAEPQPPGRARIVAHSVFWQYPPPETRAAIKAAIEAAGAEATTETPLAWLTFEPKATVAIMHLDLRLWPGDETLHLGTCHPHGTWINWAGAGPAGG